LISGRIIEIRKAYYNETKLGMLKLPSALIPPTGSSDLTAAYRNSAVMLR